MMVQETGLTGYAVAWCWINRDIDVAMRAERIGLAGQPFRMERDAARAAWVKFTAGQLQLKLL